MVIEYKKLLDVFNKLNLKNKSDSINLVNNEEILKNNVTELLVENKNLKVIV